jgi:hypothetical protein
VDVRRAKGDRSPFSFVIVEGDATWSDGPAQVLAWATRIGGRYMGADRADEYGARNGAPGEQLVRVAATQVIAEAALAD